MALIQSKYAKGIIPVAYPSIAGAATVQRFSHQIATALAVGDIIELGVIPAGCRVAEIVIDSDDLDSNGAPAVAFDVGVMSGGWGSEDQARTCGAEFFAASNVGQAGTVARPTLRSAYRVAASNIDRSIGVKLTTLAATFQAGQIGITVTLTTE